MREVLAGWKTKATAIFLGAKLVAVDHYEVLLEQVGDLGNTVFNLVVVGLVIVFRHLGNVREQKYKEVKALLEKVQKDLEDDR